MSEHNETLADIVAEMRYGTIPKHRTDHELLALYADRIEAAHKREVDKLNSVIQAQRSAFDAEQDRQRRAAPGNAAALREAVALALSLLDLKEGVPSKAVSQKDIDFMKAALAKPPRNCDLYNDVEDSWQDYKQFRRQIGEAIYFDMVHFWPFAKWLFAPATEQKGEGDGSK